MGSIQLTEEKTGGKDKVIVRFRVEKKGEKDQVTKGKPSGVCPDAISGHNICYFGKILKKMEHDSHPTCF